MKRRDILSTIATGAAAALAGCSSSGDADPETETTQASASSVSLSAEGVDPVETNRRITVDYASMATLRYDTDPDDDAVSRAADGSKWLAVGLEVTNASESGTWSTSPSRYVVEAGGETFSTVSTGEADYFPETETDLDPGGAASGYVLFEIPRDSTSATLTVDLDEVPSGTSLTFAQSDDVAIPLGSDQTTVV